MHILILWRILGKNTNKMFESLHWQSDTRRDNTNCFLSFFFFFKNLFFYAEYLICEEMYLFATE